MSYLIGYTQEEADHWGGVFLDLARAQLGTVAAEWGKVELTDGTWAVPLDEGRQALADIPAELQQRLADRIAEGRLKTRDELIEAGLLVEPQARPLSDMETP